ncbi:MAG: hypothetical protein HC876_23040 [Chloroflexaceae bacterium]|nr:hypothetical protein [Chloroflexaceae bacterium]
MQEELQVHDEKTRDPACFLRDRCLSHLLSFVKENMEQEGSVFLYGFADAWSPGKIFLRKIPCVLVRTRERVVCQSLDWWFSGFGGGSFKLLYEFDNKLESALKLLDTLESALKLAIERIGGGLCHFNLLSGGG